MLTLVLEGSLLLDDLLSDYFLRELHRRMYGDIWNWAGLYRQRELNIGVATRTNCRRTSQFPANDPLSMGTQTTRPHENWALPHTLRV